MDENDMNYERCRWCRQQIRDLNVETDGGCKHLQIFLLFSLYL